MRIISFAAVVCLASAALAQTPVPEIELPALPETAVVSQPIVARNPVPSRLRNVTTDANLSGNVGEIIWDSPATSFILRSLGSTTPITFETNGAERMRIFDSGRVSIGNTTTNGKLSIYDYDDNSRGISIFHHAIVEATAAQPELGLWVNTSQEIAAGVNNSAVLVGGSFETYSYGPGTVTGAIGVRTLTGYKGTTAGTLTTVYGNLIQIEKGVGTITNGFGIYLADVQATNDWGIYQAGSTDINYFNGDVGIGTNAPASGIKLHVVGNVKVDGELTATSVIGATYQDLAEWVPATNDLAPGTVVVLNTDKSNEVMASRHEYDTAVAGVVSAQPGIILGEASDSKEQIATTGRVKVRVDASFGAIKVGDLLVTSRIPGTAMKSQPIDVAGHKMHQPGTIIGKALEPLASGSGEILVLLSLQ